jgi:hypothetical protein
LSRRISTGTSPWTACSSLIWSDIAFALAPCR